MSFGGPTIWSYEGGFGSSGFWSGIVGGWADVITGAPNPFRASGEIVASPGGVSVPVVIGEIPQTWEELEQQMPELFEPILETRPGRVADSYPQDSTVAATDSQLDKTPAEEDEMAIDWGAFISGGIDLLQGQDVGGGSRIAAPPQQRDAFLLPSTPTNQLATSAAMTGCDGIAWGGGVPPKGYKVVNYCGQGVLRKVRRRRRRRMLTASDASDLATIVGIVGKGQMASSMINRTRS